MMLAERIGAPFDGVDYLCAGINHQAWYLEYKWNGEDAYPLIHKAITEQPEIYNAEPVAIYRAIAHDPLTSAVLLLAEICQMTNKLFAQHEDYLPQCKHHTVISREYNTRQITIGKLRGLQQISSRHDHRAK